MNYKNAKDLLPEKLLNELQKYASGELIYIPKSDKDKAKWGVKNGTRKKYEYRNQKIRSLKESGMTINEIAQTYFLSPESIKKILYDQNQAR